MYNYFETKYLFFLPMKLLQILLMLIFCEILLKCQITTEFTLKTLLWSQCIFLLIGGPQ